MSVRSIRDVVENGLCVGCGLCEVIGGGNGLRMAISERGFFRPVTDDGLPRETTSEILAVCPGTGIDRPPPATETDRIWGPVRAMRRAHAVDPDIRFRGSSGGVITALMAHLLRTGEVDGVIQIGAGPDEPLVNRVVVSRTPADVVARAGSRYAPSAPLAGLGDVLNGDERFALVGKPCDIAGLRALARRDPRVDRMIPWMISFFCAGVPSLEGTRELLSRLGVDEGEVSSVRYRGEGWPGRFRVETRSGRTESLSYARSWGDVLSRHLQFRCKICPDGTGELADLAAADAWVTADGYPDFDERDGWSAVVARTPRGERLLRDAASSGALALAPLSAGELAAMQPYQRDRKQAALARLAAVMLAGGKVPRFRGLGLGRAALGATAKWPRNFAGTFLRVLRGANRE